MREHIRRNDAHNWLLLLSKTCLLSAVQFPSDVLEEVLDILHFLVSVGQLLLLQSLIPSRRCAHKLHLSDDILPYIRVRRLIFLLFLADGFQDASLLLTSTQITIVSPLSSFPGSEIESAELGQALLNGFLRY